MLKVLPVHVSVKGGVLPSGKSITVLSEDSMVSVSDAAIVAVIDVVVDTVRLVKLPETV
jgi:hypothetical protein